MSLVLDDKNIERAEAILEIAIAMGHEVYAAVSDALKGVHPSLVKEAPPAESSAEVAEAAEAMIDAKFGAKADASKA